MQEKEREEKGKVVRCLEKYNANMLINMQAFKLGIPLFFNIDEDEKKIKVFNTVWSVLWH